MCKGSKFTHISNKKQEAAKGKIRFTLKLSLWLTKFNQFNLLKVRVFQKGELYKSVWGSILNGIYNWKMCDKEFTMHTKRFNNSSWKVT